MYNLISCKAIIGKATSSFGISSTSITNDLIDCIGECIGLIGYHTGFINKLRRVQVENYTFSLPCDYVDLNCLIYNGKILRKKKGLSEVKEPYNQYFDNLIGYLTQDIYGIDDFCDVEDFKISNERTHNKIESLLFDIKRASHYEEHHFYTENENCYKVSYESGYVYIDYKSYPLDSEGLPMVIDEVHYKRALEYYCILELLKRGYKHPVFNYQMVSADSRRYITTATNQNLKMNRSEMNDFVTKWTSLY